ncbi:hypothetical protein D3C73_1631370 [compost metagenome]
MGDRSDQREGTMAQGTAGGDDVHAGVREFLQNINRVGDERQVVFVAQQLQEFKGG